MTVSISITGADAVQKELAKYAGISVQEIATNAAVTVKATMRRHFVDYGNSNRNKFGAPSTGYWSRAAQATEVSVSGGLITAEVFEGKTSLVGVRRHYTGGGAIKPSGRTSEVTGRPISRLTIPARAEAHGKSVATLRALGVNLYRAGGTLREQTGAKRSDNDPVYFYLAKQVGPMKPNPRILPTDAQFVQAISETVEDILATPNG